MDMYLKITGVDKMALNKIHELLDGDSFMSQMEFVPIQGHHVPGKPMNCVELQDSRLDHRKTYTIKLRIVLSIRKSLGGGKEGYFLTPHTILDQIFQALEIMPDQEEFKVVKEGDSY